MATKLTRMLRQQPGGHLFIWAPQLATRVDMEEVLLEEDDTETPVPVIRAEKKAAKPADKKADKPAGKKDAPKGAVDLGGDDVPPPAPEGDDLKV